MPPTLTQDRRRLKIETPLGPDVLLIRHFHGREGISSLFHYEVDAFAGNADAIDFSKLLGKPVIVRVELQNGQERVFHGLVTRVARGARGNDYTAYRLEVAPRAWMLTRIQRSRIFQHQTVPEILEAVLSGCNIKPQIQGTFEKRDFCVQYRESDFSFVSRLMEEEGIYYFFRIEDNQHQMVLANTPQGHPDVPQLDTLFYDELDGGHRPDEVIHYWEKSQEVRSGKVTLWDHCFELPHKHLESEEPIQQSVTVGKASHALNTATEGLEIYDYPGAYAQRFDGISASGGEQAGELQKIYQDNKRTTGLRMQEEAMQALHIDGRSNFAGLVPGHKFNLARHFYDDGAYLLTECEFQLSQLGSYFGGESPDEDVFETAVDFRCIPVGLPYRPSRLTPKPVIVGTQTAVVVGPAGEEIFTDKYGRIKVQFHWDREGKMNGDSSCWVRVATPWAGKNWGFLSLPRIGHEVVIAFEEGDPDRPIVTGSVYNADMMPPYKLPDSKTVSTWKSRSSVGGGGFNEIRYEDKKGSEQIFIHAERNLDERIKANRMQYVGNDKHAIIQRDTHLEVARDVHEEIGRDLIHKLGRDHHVDIAGKEGVHIAGSKSLQVDGSSAEKIGGDLAIDASSIYLKAGKKIILEAGSQISLKVGGNFVDISPSGVSIKGTMVLINSGGAAGSGDAGSILMPLVPKKPAYADNATPGGAVVYVPTPTPEKPWHPGPSPGPGPNPGPGPGPGPDNPDKTHWIAIELKDSTGKPVPFEAYKVVLPDGSETEGTLDDKGKARIDGIDPGQCQVSFPNLADWEKA